jgi:hypothetical protein
VDAVKDTANVRYRIATCLDALGRRAEAFASYEAAARLGAGETASAETVRAATARSAQLEGVVPQLTLVLSQPPRSGLEVRIDDAPVDPRTLGVPVRLDVGHHTVAATAPGATPFHVSLTLAEGGRVSVNVALDAETAALAPPTEPRAGTLGYVALGIGGLLAVGSVVSLLLRASNVATLEQCPLQAGIYQCPSSDRGAYDAARTEGPLAIGLGAGATVAVGLGVWWLVSAPAPAPSPVAGVRLVPGLSQHGAALLLSGTFER